MLQLLNPIALLAIAAVAVPVLVHLWNVRKGKTLRVGSIALLTVSSRQRSNRLRINNWPLFLLRCLLLVLLALLLARPVWNAAQDTTKHPGWILISGQELPVAYAHYKPQIDSLLAAGLELHNLSAGFERILLQDTASLKDTTLVIAASPWPLLKVLDASLPKGFPLHVFVNDRLSSYRGERPVTHLAIQWHSFTTGDTLTQSPALSYVTTEGKIKNIEWVTSSQGNWYSEDNVSALFTSAPDTSVIRVAIYAGQHVADAQYIKAAMQAIAQFTDTRIQVSSLASDQQPVAPQHLIFELDERLRQAQPDIESYITPKGILFSYDTGRATPVSSWMQEGSAVTAAAGQHKVYQYIPGHATGTPVWTLADGRPLLTVAEEDGKFVYRYKGRFNPAWGDMVWEDGFVKAMLPLVAPVLKFDVSLDRRRIDDKQVVPERIQNTGDRIQNPEVSNLHSESITKHHIQALSDWLWIIIFIVFAAERLLVYRQQQRVEHG
ncbi:MAG: BatA domain-containing protein [Niastella sp.]|nr:BatA domain-containing protein [Niastella sp.]